MFGGPRSTYYHVTQHSTSDSPPKIKIIDYFKVYRLYLALAIVKQRQTLMSGAFIKEEKYILPKIKATLAEYNAKITQ